MLDTQLRPRQPWLAAATTLTGTGGLSIDLTPAGDIAGVAAGEGRTVSGHRIGPHDAGLAGVYLRRIRGAAVDYSPLTGSRSSSVFAAGDGVAVWTGSALGATWTVTLAPDTEAAALVWRVEVQAPADDDATWELVATQDLALAPAQAAQSSEAYVSQYVAHRLAEDPALGTAVLSRQTMSVAPQLPMFAFAIAEGAAHAGTDALDLYTPAVRSGAAPAFLTSLEWPDRVRQHEAAMAALRSRPAAGGSLVWHVVGLYWPDRRGPMLDVMTEVSALVEAVAGRSDAAAVAAPPTAGRDERSLLTTADLLVGDRLEDDALLALAEDPQFVERDGDGAVLSYFGARGVHVVRGDKDDALVRPHGHVMIAGDALSPERPTLSTTVFHHGVFGSHTVLGNTSFDRLVSVHRQHLNLVRSNGQRVLVRLDGTWTMLGQPSALVLDVGEARWIYRHGATVIEVRTVASAASDAILTEVTSVEPLDVLVTADIDLAAGAWSATSDGGSLVFRADPDTAPARHHDGLTYVIAASAGVELGDDAPLFADTAPRGTSVITARANAATRVRLAYAADLAGGTTARDIAADLAQTGLEARATAAAHREVLGRLTRDLAVVSESRLAELEVLLPWWANDARVHYLVPHGLEQYSGAAWGTRDVCQGPFEMLLAAGRFEDCRDIILRVLATQSTGGTFPQWFMFDDYSEIYQEHSHGDVVHWPLFALGQYLEATGDLGILEVEVPFRDAGAAPVLAHIDALVSHVESETVAGTALPVYGDGDWDDTLQPAVPEMRAHMASTWTSALAYQALRRAQPHLARVPAAAGLADRVASTASAMGEDIRRHMIPSGVSAGFVRFEDGGATPVIHPEDRATGLTYRLIPMTQLMLAGIFDQDQAARHESIIREHLHFPDGVRLTDAPSRFNDGETTFFLRAEQAAFFGREVGLMYVHAHIRWAEALDALGRADVGEELLRLSPIGMRERVPSASLRQRTCYTSSSDADFPDRYTAARDFGLLRTGEVRTVDGWRVYSSGPGIFIRQVLQSLLGVKEGAEGVIFEPTLAPADDGLEVRLVVAGAHRIVRFHVDPTATAVEVALDGVTIPSSPVPHPYRWSGARVALDLLTDAAVIDVRTPAGS